MKIQYTLLWLLLLAAAPALRSQSHFLEPADSLHKGRFWTCAGLGAALYGTASYGLYHAWYKDFELTKFRTFDDSREWMGMDKAGHLMTAYNQSDIAFRGLRWTGMARRPSIWMAAGVGSLLQATVEIMDAHSAKWGFSWYDIGFNTLGVGAFVGQELAWQEQRIRFKISNARPAYPDYVVFPADGGPGMSLQERADELFGESYGEAFLKDYNGQIIWASVNLEAFMGDAETNWMPPWLNLAGGFSARNLFGGYSNGWNTNGYAYRLEPDLFPRQWELYLSLDVDLDRIPTERRFLRTLLGMLNWIKIPAPALEIRQGGSIRFRPLMW